LEAPPKATSADFHSVVTAIRIRVFEAHGLVVRSITFVKRGAIPKTSSGKIRRAYCKSLLIADQLSMLFQWPSNDPIDVRDLAHKSDAGLRPGYDVHQTIEQGLREK